MRVENRILLIAFFLLLILASSAGHDDGLRGGSRAAEDNNREAQLPTFSSFFAFLWSLLRRFAAVVLSVPTALLQFLLSLLFSFWNFVFGIFVSVSSPFAATTTTTTTTVTLVPTTATSTLAATTSSVFFSTEMTTPATSSSAMSSLSTVPTAPTSMLLSTSTASSLTSTSSTSTSTSSTSTSTSSTTTTTSSTTTTTAQPGPKTVFLTSVRFRADFSGLAGADASCNNAARSVNLPGNFFAWLSDATDSPNTRFTRSRGPYLLVDGTKFADNYTALLSGGPLVNLDLQENNVTIFAAPSVRRAWTGTGADGNATINHCNNWRSSSNSFSGTTGDPLRPGSDWIVTQTIDCTNLRRLYCFEQ